MPLALELAEFVTRTSYADLPPLVIERAKMVIASTFASAAVGTEIESARIVRALAKEQGGTPDASAWFGGEKLPLAGDGARQRHAQRRRGLRRQRHSQRCAHRYVSTAAALAAGEKAGASGKDVLAALALGYEVSAQARRRREPRLAGLPRLRDHDIRAVCDHREAARPQCEPRRPTPSRSLRPRSAASACRPTAGRASTTPATFRCWV